MEMDHEKGDQPETHNQTPVSSKVSELLHLERQLVAIMGSQQSARIGGHVETWNPVHKSPRTQIACKKRREHKRHARTKLMPDEFEEEKVCLYTPAARRRRVPDNDKDQRDDWDCDSQYDNDIYFYTDLRKASHDKANYIANSQEGSKDKDEAAGKVMEKIEEVEGIIGRVRLASSDWLQEDCEGRLKVEQQDSAEELRLVEELQGLGSALTQSLHQALKMESRDWKHLLSKPLTDGNTKGQESTSPTSPEQLHTTQVPNHGGSPVWLTPHTPITEAALPPFVSPILANPLGAKQTEQHNDHHHFDRRRCEEDSLHSESDEDQDDVRLVPMFSDEDLDRQEEIWQQEMEETLSFCSSLSHPSRPQHVDFLRITPPEYDIIGTPSPGPEEFPVESSTPVEEERTPGRLQAVWPPLKEERVGLKYTEAEHQAALLHLKRECKDEQEKLQGEFSEQLYRLNAEHQKKASLLQLTLAELRAELSAVGSLRRGELRDVSVSTGDEHLHKSFRTVCIQTDRETFVKTPQDGVTAVQQKICPNKLDLCLNQAGQRQETLSQDCPHPPVDKPSPVTQTTSEQTINLPPPPPPLPPPPFRPSLAPPPPPPLTFGMTSLEKKPRKPAVDPSRPMKPLYWTRIQIEDNNSGTLWNTLEEPNIVNTAEFESLFAKTSTQSKRKPLAETYEKKSKARKIKLLDGKRSQAVGILISSLHLEMKDIQQAILSVDQSVVDLETIEALYENRAQPDELERIKKHYQTCQEDDIKLLDKPEQFLYELAQIPDFAGRARCIIFRSSFTDGITTIQRKLHMVSSVCQALLASTSVRDVMGLVLAFGNRMNGGSQVRGQADGFCLEILPKLKDVKSQDNRINLVDYVVSYYLHNLDKNAGSDKSLFPLPEPQDVFTVAQVKFEDLNQDLRQLGRDLTGSENDVQRVCSNSPEKHLQPFQDKMEAFLLRAREDHVEASHQLTTTQKSFQDLVQYFGLKPKAGEKDVTPAQFFTLWFEFCADFKVRWKRENKNVSKERLKEAQMLVKRMTSEKRVETRRVNPNSLKERLRQKQAGVSS